MLDVNELYSDLKVKYDKLKTYRLQEAKDIAFELGVVKSELSEQKDKFERLQKQHNDLLEAHKKLKNRNELLKNNYEKACVIITEEGKSPADKEKKKYKSLLNRYQSLMSILRSNNLMPESDYYTQNIK